MVAHRPVMEMLNRNRTKGFVQVIRLILPAILLCVSIALSAQEFRTKTRKQVNVPDSLLPADGPVNARIIHGRVLDESSGNELPLASIFETGSSNAVYSGLDGTFAIRADLSKSSRLICYYIGFETDTVPLNIQSSYVTFRLKEKFLVKKEVVVSASRFLEREFESPVAIELLSARDLRVNPSLNMYERITNMATVDAITTSANFKTLNTRGFNTSYNQRFIQRFDNMDLSMPGFNLSLGALNGPIDLDVERMELIPGANSALYGPNAISGLMTTTSKNPFMYQGLSIEVKTGVNHIDGIDNRPQPLADFNIRYAKKLSQKLAGKVTFGYMQVADWHATDYRDISDYGYTNNLNRYGYAKGPGNPGYNGLNIGGDEVSAVFDTSITDPVTHQPFLKNGSLRVSRTGYREDQLFQYKPYMLKGDVGFYFRPNKDCEISWTSRFGLGSSNFQTDNRTQVSNYFLQQHKIEVKGKHYVFRSYLSAEDIGEAIDISLSAVNLNRAAKSDQNWFMQYLFAYSGKFNDFAKAFGYDTIQAGNDAAARKFADGDNSKYFNDINPVDSTTAKMILGTHRFEPGTKGFDSVMNIIRNKAFKDDGGRIKSTSKMWYSEFVYDFSDQFKLFTIQTGINYRLYAPNSHGSVFPDTSSLIYFNEVGGFVQIAKKFFNDRLKIQASTRLDIFQRFDPKMSPRVSLVYLAGKDRQHSIRISGQIGYRMPALIDQYSYMNVKGALTFGGFLEDAVRANLVRINSDGTHFVNMYTQSSVNAFLYTGDSTKLVKPIINSIVPEELRSVELGWRSILFRKLETDVNVYVNSFQNLISAQQYAGPINRSDTINAAYVKNQQLMQVYRRAANSQFPVSSYGIAVSLNYYHNKKWFWYSNYNFNHLITSETFISQNFEKGFNTPMHKINIGCRATDIFHKLGFTANLKYVDAFHFAEYDRIGDLSAYYTLDMAFNYVIPTQKILLKAGGTNVTNNRYLQALGSPTVGALYYVSIIFDESIK